MTLPYLPLSAYPYILLQPPGRCQHTHSACHYQSLTLPTSFEQERQCTTKNWGAFVHPMSQWKLQCNKYYTFWVCICSLRFPECNVHVPYYIVICGPSGRTLFFQIVSLKSMIFEKKITENKMCVLIFSIIFVWKCSYSKKTERIMIINVRW